MFLFRQIFPLVEGLRDYKGIDFIADSIAGLVVLFITVPQVIAYAYLAGMPAEAGLYAVIVALVCYAVVGSSRTLAVGPTAIIAMMTLEAASEYSSPGTAAYGHVAMKLGLITGMTLLLLRLINFGAIISFLSHAVISGFITAAAILIITNQLPAVIGIASSPATDVVTVLQHLITGFRALNPATFIIGGGTILLLIWCRFGLANQLEKIGLSELLISALTRSAPMYAVIFSVLIVFLADLDSTNAVAIVGHIPASLPTLQYLDISMAEIKMLSPSALLIAMVVFMESTSIGSAVASKRREKINPNQELVGLGFANISAAFAGGFPVAGSFARTIVNHSAGAVSQVAALITALLVVITVLWLTPLFYYLPKSVLSAIIVVSAVQLIDWQNIKKIFSFNRIDAVTFSFTFMGVLALGVESGVLIGIVISFVLLIRDSSKPHIAVVGRWQNTEHFRNVLRHEVETYPAILSVRIDESLYFVNSRYIETFLLNKVADSPALEHILLICTATNFIDISGLEMLELLDKNLQEVGVTLHLAEVKGPVMDQLGKTDFLAHMRGEIFFTTDIALHELVNKHD